jgi:chaperonin GroEL
MIRKVKTSPKMFVSDPARIKAIVLEAMDEISQVVGATLGPSGKNVLIESDYPGIPNKNTKDGVTVFKSLGHSNSYKHLIIEQTRDAAQRTASEAGDGTTTATVLASAMVQYLHEFCENNRKYSPQKAAREMSKIVREQLIPKIRERAIKIDTDNQHLLKMVAKISANGDEDMATAVIKAFELVGYGESSHVTIKELSGPYGYEVGLIEGFPIPIGYEESIGKFHSVFINDQGNQRCVLENPLFLLYDGQINDIVQFSALFEALGRAYVEEGKTEYKNLVIFAHGYSDHVLTQLAYNFGNPNTMNIVPIVTPMAQFINSQLQFLMDVSAFTGAKVFGLKDKVMNATPEDLGKGMEIFEAYRFRSTIVGNPDEVNVEVRADQLRKQKETAESQAEKTWLEERLGKITNGIAKLTIYGGSNGELKEAHDRCEDAVCAVRSAISKGALPGGCRVLIDLAIHLSAEYPENDVVTEILIPSLLTPINRLLDNAGYTSEESMEISEKLMDNPDLVYDVENQQFGRAEELGVFDSAPAVEEALKNAVSIATVMGTIGGIVAYPRDDAYERSEAKEDAAFKRAVDNPEQFVNEADQRP